MTVLEMIGLSVAALWPYAFVGRIWAGHVAHLETTKPSNDDWGFGICCGVLWPATVAIAVLIVIGKHAVAHAPHLGAEKETERQNERERLAKLAKKAEREMDAEGKRQQDGAIKREGETLLLESGTRPGDYDLEY